MSKPVIVSFPRSGRTWLGTMIGLAICHETGRPIEEAIQARREHVDMTHAGTDKSLKLRPHELPAVEPSKRKTVLMIREPKDTMVSAWLHATKNKGSFKGSLEDYVRDDRFGIDKWIKFHMNWSTSGREFRTLTYKDLTLNSRGFLLNTCQYLKIPVSWESCQKAADASTLTQLQQWEKEGKFIGGPKAPKGDDTETYYHRRGKRGGWVDYMSPELADEIDRKVKGTWLLNPTL